MKMTLVALLDYVEINSILSVPQGQTVSLQPVPEIREVLYHHQPLYIYTHGPPVPELDQLQRLG